MTSRPHSAPQGFTLLEIMVVVAIIGLLVTIGLPNWFRARKRSQAARIHAELKIIDSAIAQYALEFSKPPGFSPSYDDLKRYIKPNTVFYQTGLDLFGNSYGPFTVDVPPQVPENTYNSLSDVTDAEFWGPYGR